MRSSGLAVMLALSASASPVWATVSGFVGPWAPTIENGFENATGFPSTFTTLVSNAGQVLTSQIATNGNSGSPSFFLQNYGFAFVIPISLPTGLVTFDWAITNTGANAFALYGDQGVPTVSLDAGQSVTGSFNLNYTGGYFGYFGVNIDDGLGSAQANVVLTNFTGPGEVPEPVSLVLLATGLAGLAIVRRARLH